MRGAGQQPFASALRPYLILALAGTFLSLPLIIYGLPFLSDDGVYHAIYYENFSAQLWAGEIYPRWLSGMYGGLGGPTFFYYPPLVYYFTNLFELLPVSTLHKLGMSAAVALVLSGMAAYIWLREIAERGPALIAACLYMLLPYHINFDLYVRGAVAEALTFVWMPLILYFVVRAGCGSRTALLGIAVSYALLSTTHLLTTVIFSPLPIVYSAISGRGAGRLWAVTRTLAALLLGASLGAAYLLPAITYQEFAYFGEMKSGAFDFERGLFSTSTVIYGSRRHFWIIIQVLLLTSVCLIAARSIGDREVTLQKRFWAAVYAGCLFMMHYASYPIWTMVTPLQMLQFPFRFNTVVSVAVLPLIAYGISAIKRPLRASTVFLSIVLSLLGILWVQDVGRATWISFFRPQPQSESSATKQQHYETYTDSHGMWPRSAPPSEADLSIEAAKIPHVDGRPAMAFVTDGQADVTVDKWKPRHIELRVSARDESVVNVSQFYYPGWTARIAGQEADLRLEPSHGLGILSVRVPAGDHRIEIRLEKLATEAAGEWISVISMLITLMLFTGIYFTRRTGVP